MQINCLLPAPRVEEERVVWEADQCSTSSRSCRTPEEQRRTSRLHSQAERTPNVCLPSGVPLMSVGGPVLTVRLGFCVRAFCRVQSKLSILSCMKPQIFSSSKRHVLSVGNGMGWSAAASQTSSPRVPGCLQRVSQHRYITTGVLHQAGDRWAALNPRRRLKRNISMISMIMEGLIQVDGCVGLMKWKKAKEKERFC